MLKRFGKWLGNVFAEHTVLQFLATVPAAYLAGLMLEFKQGAIIILMLFLPFSGLYWPFLFLPCWRIRALSFLLSKKCGIPDE